MKTYYIPSPQSNDIVVETKEQKKRKKRRKLWVLKPRKGPIRRDIFEVDNPKLLTPRQQILYVQKQTQMAKKKMSDNNKQKESKRCARMQAANNKANATNAKIETKNVDVNVNAMQHYAQLANKQAVAPVTKTCTKRYTTYTTTKDMQEMTNMQNVQSNSKNIDKTCSDVDLHAFYTQKHATHTCFYKNICKMELYKIQKNIIQAKLCAANMQNYLMIAMQKCCMQDK